MTYLLTLIGPTRAAHLARLGRFPKRYCQPIHMMVLVCLLSFPGCSHTEDRVTRGSKESVTSKDAGTVIDVSTSHGKTDSQSNRYVDLPKASENFVYVLNPTVGSVTLVNAQQLTIQVVDAGDRPTFIEIVEGTDDAIVLNTGSDDATIIRVNGKGIATATRMDVVHGANTMAISPDGQHMVVYFNTERQDLSGTFGDFQTVSLLSFQGGAPVATTMSVGFKPRDVFFKNDNSEAYVVTDDGVSVLNFASIAENGSGIANNISFVTSNYSENIEMFMITPDGKYAISRGWDADTINMVELETNREHALDLTGFFRVNYHTNETYWDGQLKSPVNFAALEFVPDGMYALALEFHSSSLLKIPLPDGILDPTLATLVDMDGIVADEVVAIESAKKSLVYRSEMASEQIGIVNWNVIPEGMDILFDAGCRDDDFEDNDTLESAFVIEPPLNETAALCGSDGDYFKIALEVGDTLDISLSFDAELGNINLYLFGPSDEPLASSESAASEESLVLTILESGMYTILVKQSTPNVFKQNYQMRVDVLGAETDTNADTDTGTDTDTVTDMDGDSESDTDTVTDSDSETAVDDTAIESGFSVLPLHKGVKYIDLAQDGNTALIIHTKKRGDPDQVSLPVEERIDRSYGYSLLHPATGDIKLQLTDVEPTGTVAVPNTDKLFLLFYNNSSPPIKEVHRVGLENFVIDPIIKLESPPISAGYLSGQHKIFVNQDHPEGRLTFIDVETSETQTVTGFELNSEIKD